LNCPVCNHPLIILELEQIEVDYCTNCHGIWLDEGELELLLQDSDEKINLLNSFKIDKKSNEKLIKCPACSKKMDKILCGIKEKVTLDKCPKQHGLWFNKGELEAVVEMGSFDLPDRQAGKQNKIVKLLKEMFSYNLS
jgi:Zn-finger nucleic acid-binding protein